MASLPLGTNNFRSTSPTALILFSPASSVNTSHTCASRFSFSAQQLMRMRFQVPLVQQFWMKKWPNLHFSQNRFSKNIFKTTYKVQGSCIPLWINGLFQKFPCRPIFLVTPCKSLVTGFLYFGYKVYIFIGQLDIGLFLCPCNLVTENRIFIPRISLYILKKNQL